jgi:UDP-glucose 4-epimerase
MAHALVTGGAGFIGSHLSEALLARGHRVTALDDLSTGSRENIKHLQDNPGFEFVLGTVLDEGAVDKLVSRSEIVYHMAAAVGVKYIIDNPLASLRTGTHAVDQQRLF